MMKQMKSLIATSTWKCLAFQVGKAPKITAKLFLESGSLLSTFKLLRKKNHSETRLGAKSSSFRPHKKILALKVSAHACEILNIISISLCIEFIQ